LIALNRLGLSLFLALWLPYQPLLVSSLLFLLHYFLTLLALFPRFLGLFLGRASRTISLALLIEDLLSLRSLLSLLILNWLLFSFSATSLARYTLGSASRGFLLSQLVLQLRIFYGFRSGLLLCLLLLPNLDYGLFALLPQFHQSLLSETFPLSLKCFQLPLMLLLLTGDSHLPLVGGNITVLLFDLVAFQVLVNLFLVEGKFDAQFVHLIGL
jgi:hypothetical protein